MRCRVSQIDFVCCVVVCCSVLQCVAVCCSVLRDTIHLAQWILLSCNVLQGDSHGRFVLQCVAECCSVLQCVAVCCATLMSRHDKLCSSASEEGFITVALCCSCVEVCCSVLESTMAWP